MRVIVAFLLIAVVGFLSLSSNFAQDIDGGHGSKSCSGNRQASVYHHLEWWQRVLKVISSYPSTTTEFTCDLNASSYTSSSTEISSTTTTSRDEADNFRILFRKKEAVEFIVKNEKPHGLFSQALTQQDEEFMKAYFMILNIPKENWPQTLSFLQKNYQEFYSADSVRYAHNVTDALFKRM
jgi:hypothetical protein